MRYKALVPLGYVCRISIIRYWFRIVEPVVYFLLPSPNRMLWFRYRALIPLCYADHFFLYVTIRYICFVVFPVTERWFRYVMFVIFPLQSVDSVTLRYVYRYRALIPVKHQMEYDRLAPVRPQQRLRVIHLKRRNVNEGLGFAVRGRWVCVRARVRAGRWVCVQRGTRVRRAGRWVWVRVGVRVGRWVCVCVGMRTERGSGSARKLWIINIPYWNVFYYFRTTVSYNCPIDIYWNAKLCPIWLSLWTEHFNGRLTTLYCLPLRCVFQGCSIPFNF